LKSTATPLIATCEEHRDPCDFAYAIFYNYNVTKSTALAISTSLLRQLAVLGVIFLFIRWRGNEVNRGR
jgi:hypothetical protein